LVVGILVNFGGEPVILSSVLDFSERKEMEVALRTTERSTRRVFPAAEHIAGLAHRLAIVCASSGQSLREITEPLTRGLRQPRGISDLRMEKSTHHI